MLELLADVEVSYLTCKTRTVRGDEVGKEGLAPRVGVGSSALIRQALSYQLQLQLHPI